MAIELKKSMGLFTLSLYSTGIIIGAGIYSILGVAAGSAGYSLWISFILAAAVAGLTGLSYAELASAMPKAGAEFVYARRAFPRWPSISFIAGFMLTVATCASACTVALAFAGYLTNFVTIPTALAAFLVLVLCSGVNLMGISESSRINVVFTLIEISGLLLVIWLGIFKPEAFTPLFDPKLHEGVFTGTALIFFVYLGFQNVANVAEETKNPGRTIPLAIIISLVLVTILYLLIALSVMALSTPQDLAQSEYPLLTAIQGKAPGLVSTLGAIALFSTANTVLISMISGSRMIYGMARAKALPSSLAKLSRNRQSPWVAVIVTLGLASIFLPFGAVEVVGAFSSAASLLAFALVSICLIVLRYREPQLVRPFRVPLSIGPFPVFPALALLSIGGLSFYFDQQIYWITAIMLATGAAIYFAWTKMTMAR